MDSSDRRMSISKVKTARGIWRGTERSSLLLLLLVTSVFQVNISRQPSQNFLPLHSKKCLKRVPCLLTFLFLGKFYVERASWPASSTHIYLYTSKFPTPPVESLSLDFYHTLFYKTLCSSLFISHFLESFFVFFDRKMNSIRSFALPILGFFVMALFQISHGQGLAPSPAPNAPTSDAIGGVTGELLEQNAHALDQISANFAAFKVHENINLFCQARNNILTIMNDMNDMPEIMKQMPPLPVKLNEELVNSILPRSSLQKNSLS